MFLAIALWAATLASQTYTPIYSVYEGGAYGIGAGVYISKTHVLTANHVITGAAAVFLDREYRVEAVVERTDEKKDLALLRVPEHRWFAKLGNPKLYSPVVSFGTPRGATKIASFGRISAIQSCYLLLDARVMHGFSGGGIYDGRAELVGIVVQAWGDDFATFAIGASCLKEFLTPRVNFLDTPSNLWHHPRDGYLGSDTRSPARAAAAVRCSTAGHDRSPRQRPAA